MEWRVGGAPRACAALRARRASRGLREALRKETSAAAVSLLAESSEEEEEVDEEEKEVEVVVSPPSSPPSSSSSSGLRLVISSSQLSSAASRKPSTVDSAAKSTCPRASSRLPAESEARTAGVGNDLFVVEGKGSGETEFVEELEELVDELALARVLSPRLPDTEGLHSGSSGVEARIHCWLLWLIDRGDEEKGGEGRASVVVVVVAAFAFHRRGGAAPDASRCLPPPPSLRPGNRLMATTSILSSPRAQAGREKAREGGHKGYARMI